ncbi:HD-GYP domain-containing protein [Geotoga petraea]|uniref:HD domain-containing protein n=1 Tax=Geotoga petraea TaxID=28234 RepID=A0A1G6KUB2_9BACT|nr:HD-GYP domain-containing protein [Geotoga petraea]SDC34564.1 HD domain-containing protein [Geotoga petraea]
MINFILIIFFIVVLILTIFLFISRSKIQKQARDLRYKIKEIKSHEEELEEMNKDLEEYSQENNQLSEKLYLLINILSDLNNKNLSVNKYYDKLLKTILFLVPEAKYGSVSISDEKGWRFLSTVGHDIEYLNKLDLKASNKIISNEVKIYDNLLDRLGKFMDRETQKKFGFGTKPIKSSLIGSIDIEDEINLSISIDIPYFSKENFDNNSKKILESFLNLASSYLNQKLEGDKLKRAYIKFTNKLAMIAEGYDDITGTHIYRVGKLSKLLAKNMDIPEEKIEEIEVFAPLHDIGKIFVPPEILKKPGKLTEEEFEEMKKHTIMSKKLLDSKYFKTAQNIAMYHHEKYDGSGYPFGLKGEEIPIEAQIVSIIDVYDALRSKRPYKDGFSHEKTMKIITNGDNRTKTSHFSPEILEAFLKVEKEIENKWGIL